MRPPCHCLFFREGHCSHVAEQWLPWWGNVIVGEGRCARAMEQELTHRGAEEPM